MTVPRIWDAAVCNAGSRFILMQSPAMGGLPQDIDATTLTVDGTPVRPPLEENAGILREEHGNLAPLVVYLPLAVFGFTPRPGSQPGGGLIAGRL